MSIRISGRLKPFTGAVKFKPERIQWTFFDPYEPGKTYSAIHEYRLGVGSIYTNPQDLHFSPDGTRLFIIRGLNEDIVSYTLSIPWDISSAVSDNKSFNVNSQDGIPKSVFFKPDGTMMFVAGTQSDSVHAYTLSTPWDVTTASYTNTSLFVGDHANNPYGIHFSPDGTRMFAVAYINGYAFSYVLSTPWDISTASYEKQVYIPDTNIPAAIYFTPSGNRFFTVDLTNKRICSFSLTIPWDIATASYDNISYSVADQEPGPMGLFFASDGTRMFIVGDGDDAVNSYIPQVS